MKYPTCWSVIRVLRLCSVRFVLAKQSRVGPPLPVIARRGGAWDVRVRGLTPGAPWHTFRRPRTGATRSFAWLPVEIGFELALGKSHQSFAKASRRVRGGNRMLPRRSCEGQLTASTDSARHDRGRWFFRLPDELLTTRASLAKDEGGFSNYFWPRLRKQRAEGGERSGGNVLERRGRG